jgi:hypothetical protein
MSDIRTVTPIRSAESDHVVAGCTVRQVTDQLTQPGRRGSKTGRAALLAVAITAVIAGAVALAYVLGWGIADDKQATAGPVSTADVARQMQCTGIQREFEAWKKSEPLVDMERLRGVLVTKATKDAVDEGSALSKAVSGYKDKPTLALAVAVGNYNFAIGVLNLQASVENDYRDEDYAKAMNAYGEVGVKYNEFWSATCK